MIELQRIPVVCQACGERWEWEATDEMWFDVESRPPCGKCGSDKVVGDHSWGRSHRFGIRVPFKAGEFEMFADPDDPSKPRYIGSEQELRRIAIEEGVNLFNDNGKQLEAPEPVGVEEELRLASASQTELENAAERQGVLIESVD